MLYFSANPILILAAVIPAILLAIFVYRADKLDHESPIMLISLILYGIISTFFALLSERAGTFLLDIFVSESSPAYNIIMYFIVVALSEEGFKYILLRKKTWLSPEFNCQFDGVVYAVFVSLGFALWENISYVVMYGLGTAMLRAVTAVPGHACFGVFMGLWYGLAKRYDNYGNPQKSRVCRRLALIVPTLLHGAYDYIASIEDQRFAWIFFVFIAVLFFVAWRLVRRMSKRDQYIDNGFTGW